MVNQRIVKYLKDNLAKKLPLNSLKQSLVNSGWSKEQIQEAIISLKAPKKEIKPSIKKIQTLPKPTTKTIKQPVKKQPIKKEQIAKEETGYFKRVKTILFHPTEFFGQVTNETKYWPPLKFIIKFYLILFVIQSIFSVLAYLVASIKIKISSLVLSIGLGLVLSPIGVIIGAFIGAFVVHIGILILGGRQGFFNTFKPLTYTSIVAFSYSIILIIVNGILSLLVTLPSKGIAITNIVIIVIIFISSMIHTTIVEVIGISKFQNISKLRAFFGAVFLPIMVIGAIITFLVFTFFGGFTLLRTLLIGI